MTLAGHHWDRVTNRDPVKTYTLVDAAGLAELAPAVDWSAWARGLRAEAPFAEVVVRQPDYLTALSTALEEVDLASWQDWLRLRVAEAFAGYLHDAVVAERFDFHGRTLSGIPEQRARWKRGVSLVDDALGEAVGELYVQRHFPPAAKERMSELVGHLVEAFRRSFAGSAWMGEETREAAAAKLVKTDENPDGVDGSKFSAAFKECEAEVLRRDIIENAHRVDGRAGVGEAQVGAFPDHHATRSAWAAALSRARISPAPRESRSAASSWPSSTGIEPGPESASAARSSRCSANASTRSRDSPRPLRSAAIRSRQAGSAVDISSTLSNFSSARSSCHAWWYRYCLRPAASVPTAWI